MKYGTLTAIVSAEIVSTTPPLTRLRAGHFGLVSPAVLDYALPAIGIPFLLAAIVEIWLVVKAISQYMRARRSQT